MREIQIEFCLRAGAASNDREVIVGEAWTVNLESFPVLMRETMECRT